MLRHAHSVLNSLHTYGLPNTWESIPFPVRTIPDTDYRGIARYEDWIMYGKGDEPGLRVIGKWVKLPTWKLAYQYTCTTSLKCTNKNWQKRHGLGHVTLIKFGTPSNIGLSLKRIKLQTRNLAQGCIRTISPKWPIKISVKGRGLGHVTPIKFGKPSDISPKRA